VARKYASSGRRCRNGSLMKITAAILCEPPKAELRIGLMSSCSGGRVRRETRTLPPDGSDVVTAYSYDPLNELTSVNVAGKITNYAYDVVGNRLSITAPGTSTKYSYDQDGRLLASDSATFTYDANGSETSNHQTSGGPSTVYTYDAANRLVKCCRRKFHQ
jgi:YD repeat-containing protein